MTESKQPPPADRVPPRRRRYAEGNHGRNVDAGERTQGILTSIFGFFLGGLFAVRLGYPYLLGGIVGAPVMYFMVKGLLTLGVRLTVGSFLAPSGGSTPRRREYSAAVAQVQAGNVPGAIAAYEQHVAEDPADPEPYLRLARLHRDHADDLQGAEQWLRRAQRDAHLDRGRELFVLQELADLYVNRMRKPRKAIPELRLLIDRFPGTPAAQTALGELAALREMLTREHEGGPTLTEQFLEKDALPDGPSDPQPDDFGRKEAGTSDT